MLPCKEWESFDTRQFRHTARVGMSAGTEVRCVCSCVCVGGRGTGGQWQDQTPTVILLKSPPTQ